MPRLPIDYANTIIYKIVCNDLSIIGCYVGHTTDFTVRKHLHKVVSANENGKEYNTKLYTTIRANGGWENYSMVEIEKFACKDANEARAKEREWFETLNSILNTYYPQRSREEYIEDNKEKLSENKRQYYKNNKEEMNLKDKKYYEANRIERLLKQNQYNIDNKEEISKRNKERRKSRKVIRVMIGKPFVCECGKETTHDHKSRHIKTLFHLQFVRTAETLTP